MQHLDSEKLRTVSGGLAPLAWFLISFGLTYAGCALVDSEDTHKGINDGNGNCDE